jgi:capsular polysaccharide transport system permease protein
MNDLNVPPANANVPAPNPNLPAQTHRQELMPKQRQFPLAPLQRVQHVVQRHYGKLFFIALPTLLAAIYFFVIAADMYASEARFIVRSPSRAPSTGVSGFLQSSGITRAQDDVYSVQDFASSRDAVAALSADLDLRAIYGREEADWIARFPNLYDRDNSEDFFRYYKRRVDVQYDTTTGIVKMVVLAFRPEDAQLVATRLLDAAEALVNRLNERARSNAVKNAEIQLRISEKAVADAQAQVLEYRNRELMIDPEKTSGAMFESLAKLQEEQQATRLRIAELSRRSPNSPLLGDLRDRVRELDLQVVQQRRRLAGGTTSMAPKISEYEQLTLRQELATKEYSSALASLESSRADARRQQIYLDRVVTPNLPDRALYPRRIRAVFIVLVTCFLVYSIGALLIAGVREHAQD